LWAAAKKIKLKKIPTSSSSSSNNQQQLSRILLKTRKNKS
jgi:hypothetical protein